MHYVLTLMGFNSHYLEGKTQRVTIMGQSGLIGISAKKHRQKKHSQPPRCLSEEGTRAPSGASRRIPLVSGALCLPGRKQHQAQPRALFFQM